jgi:hypothetical protein
MPKWKPLASKFADKTRLALGGSILGRVSIVTEETMLYPRAG